MYKFGTYSIASDKHYLFSEGRFTLGPTHAGGVDPDPAHIF